MGSSGRRSPPIQFKISCLRNPIIRCQLCNMKRFFSNLIKWFFLLIIGVVVLTFLVAAIFAALGRLDRRDDAVFVTFTSDKELLIDPAKVDWGDGALTLKEKFQTAFAVGPPPAPAEEEAPTTPTPEQ